MNSVPGTTDPRTARAEFELLGLPLASFRSLSRAPGGLERGEEFVARPIVGASQVG